MGCHPPDEDETNCIRHERYKVVMTEEMGIFREDTALRGVLDVRLQGDESLFLADLEEFIHHL